MWARNELAEKGRIGASEVVVAGNTEFAFDTSFSLSPRQAIFAYRQWLRVYAITCVRATTMPATHHIHSRVHNTLLSPFLPSNCLSFSALRGCFSFFHYLTQTLWAYVGKLVLITFYKEYKYIESLGINFETTVIV